MPSLPGFSVCCSEDHYRCGVNKGRELTKQPSKTTDSSLKARKCPSGDWGRDCWGYGPIGCFVSFFSLSISPQFGFSPGQHRCIHTTSPFDLFSMCFCLFCKNKIFLCVQIWIWQTECFATSRRSLTAHSPKQRPITVNKVIPLSVFESGEISAEHCS